MTYCRLLRNIFCMHRTHAHAIANSAFELQTLMDGNVYIQVNSPDENGLLEGNWSEDFSGGVPPTKWTGSVKILQKYYSTKKPVKYAQCWVFSGVVTTGT